METFVNFLCASIISAAPLLFATVGEILTEKTGSLNLGVEGLMSVSYTHLDVYKRQIYRRF